MNAPSKVHQSLKIFQGLNFLDLQNEINIWVQSQIPPGLVIRHTETTSSQGGSELDGLPVITICLWYGEPMG